MINQNHTSYEIYEYLKGFSRLNVVNQGDLRGHLFLQKPVPQGPNMGR
jgi:hypothetical protein